MAWPTIAGWATLISLAVEVKPPLTTMSERNDSIP